MTVKNTKLLIIDDEADIRDMLADIFTDEGYQVSRAAHSEQALSLLKEVNPDLIILDIWLENSDMDGMEILQYLKKSEYKNTPVLMISGHGNIEMAVKAMKTGAYDFIEKPFKIDHILLTAERAAEQGLLKKENEKLRQQSHHSGNRFKTKSPALLSLYKGIEDHVDSDARVLIEGERGTGKTKLAHYIHDTSSRKKSDCHTFHAADLNNAQIASFFDDKKYANSTIIIEELHMMPHIEQQSLLRCLNQQKTGEVKPRFICTSSICMKECVTHEDFSSALYDRLAVLKWRMPSLRERVEDFSDLVAELSANVSRELMVPSPQFSPDLMRALKDQDWPVNIRQLKVTVEWLLIRNMAESANLGLLTMQDYDAIHSVDSIADGEKSMADGEIHQEDWLSMSLKDARERFEIYYLTHILEQFKGSISQMATHVDMERTALHRKLKSMGIRYNQDQDDDIEYFTTAIAVGEKA